MTFVFWGQWILASGYFPLQAASLQGAKTPKSKSAGFFSTASVSDVSYEKHWLFARQSLIIILCYMSVLQHHVEAVVREQDSVLLKAI